MNEDILKGQWKQIQGRLRKRWGKLTDDDVDLIKGDAEILKGKIQEHYGRTREQAVEEIDRFLAEEYERVEVPASRR